MHFGIKTIWKNSVFLLIQLLILVGEINSRQLLLTGKFLDVHLKESEANYENDPDYDIWFNQTLDHFSPTDNRYWWQRYFVNETHFGWENDSPIFLMLGGEDGITPGWMTSGFWVEKAVEQKALLLYLEHRFYGESKPTDDLSIENLQYLTIEQALEDVVSFIAEIRQYYHLSDTNKWILFGGSYPGNLVAWFRLKYPHLVHGVISSSAPVLSVLGFKDYFKVVAESLATYNSTCADTIKEAYSSIEKLCQDEKEQEILTAKFNLCDALEDSDDFENDFGQLNVVLANTIAEVVQANKVVHDSNSTIDNICNIMADVESGSSLDRFAVLQATFLYALNESCLETGYQNFIDYFNTSSWANNTNDYRQWIWQTCNQIGNLQSSSSEPHVFGYQFPARFQVQKCQAFFGSKYTAEFIQDRVQQTNNVYLGLDIVNQVDRVVFVQGSIDPCHALGIIKSSNPKSPAFFIKGTAHCADMMAYHHDFLPALKEARNNITSIINDWLS